MSNIYTVTINHQGKTHNIKVPEERTILEVADEENIGLPSSCHAGVCTTCAAKVLEGEVDQSDAMGVSPELQAEGYTLLCVARPRSNLKLESEQEEAVYQRQFGQSS